MTNLQKIAFWKIENIGYTSYYIFGHTYIYIYICYIYIDNYTYSESQHANPWSLEHYFNKY